MQSEAEDQSQTRFDPSIKDTIRIAGATALFPIMSEWGGLFHEKYPNIHVEVTEATTKESQEKANQGLIDLAMISQELQIRSECYRVAVAKSAVIPLINLANPYLELIKTRGVTHQQLLLAYQTGEAVWEDWFEGSSANPVSLLKRADTSGAGITWAQFLWMDLTDIQGIPMRNEAEMLDRIAQDVFAMGYANMNNAFDIETKLLKPGLMILPMDLNYNGRIDFKEQIEGDIDEFRRAVCLGKYPKNLCRNLYLAAPAEPTSPSVREFISFCLTEGQYLVAAMGYGNIR